MVTVKASSQIKSHSVENTFDPKRVSVPPWTLKKKETTKNLTYI